jgi:uncharacterized repeat protein (TIGR03847 family)
VNYEFFNPDRVMVGTRGPVGQRLFLLQVREGRRLVIIKAEKQQLKALAEWLAEVVKAATRPGHLPEDTALESEYEPDFDLGEIAVAAMGEGADLQIHLTLTSMDDEDTAEIHLTKEWAGSLAIAITRLVEAGRPDCPLCSLPLDPGGHDCPRTNGFRPPTR